MATDPLRRPEPRASEPSRPRLRLVEEERRDHRVAAWALLAALLLHLLALATWSHVERTRPPDPEPAPPPLPMTFIEAPPAPEEEPPPDTPFVSERNSRAESPEPEPPPDPLDVPQPRLDEAAPTLEPPPSAPPAEPSPGPADDVRPEPVEDENPSREERLRRLREFLSAPPRDLATPPDERLPSLPYAEFGGDEIAFESRADVDWGPYASRIKRIVRENWRIPNAARVGVDGVVQVHFFIGRDGSVEELEIVGESGTVSLDVAAFDAIRLSDAFPPPPLPADSPEDRVGITWTFFYNIDEREYRLWRRERRLERRR